MATSNTTYNPEYIRWRYSTTTDPLYYDFSSIQTISNTPPHVGVDYSWKAEVDRLKNEIENLRHAAVKVSVDLNKLKELVADNMGFDGVDSLTEFLNEFRRDDE